MRSVLALALFFIPLVGCYHTVYATGAHRSSHRPSISGSNHFFLFGLANQATVDATALCAGGRPAKVDVHKSFLDGFLSLVTVGIYTPRSYEVWCAAPSSPTPKEPGHAKVAP